MTPDNKWRCNNIDGFHKQERKKKNANSKEASSTQLNIVKLKIQT